MSVFLAMLFRYFFPKLHHYLLGFRDLAFYLWGVALAIVTAQTVKSLAESNAPVGVELLIALAGLVTCAIQFYLGKQIGTRYSDRISAGQAPRTEKHRTCHLDGLYLSGPAFFSWPRIIRPVAKCF